jgi:hypothetical protein
MPSKHGRLVTLVQTLEAIYRAFETAEQQGYRSRERQYVLEMLRPHLPFAALLDAPGGLEPQTEQEPSGLPGSMASGNERGSTPRRDD